MKTVTHVSHTFVCEKCGSEYGIDGREEYEEEAKEAAGKCEALPVVEPKFAIDDEVIVRGQTTGRLFWKGAKKGKIVDVCGPYPPYPLANSAELPHTVVDEGSSYFPSLFLYRNEDYIERGFRTDRHIYFYGVRGVSKAGWRWFFEEELLSAGEEK